MPTTASGEPATDAQVRLDGTGCALSPSEAFLQELGEAVQLAAASGRAPDAGWIRRSVASSGSSPIESVEIAPSPADLLLRLCLVHGAGGRALLFEPTDPALPALARARGMEVAGEPLGKDFLLFPEAAASSAWKHRPDLAFVVSPNDPTGNAQLLAAVQALCDAVPGLVVVDERHAGFGGISASVLLDRFANLAVVRTLSPAFASAGAGLGVCVADPGVIERLQELGLSEEVPPLAAAAAGVSIAHEDEARSLVDEVIAERGRLTWELGRMTAVEVFPSEASFVLFRTPVLASRLAAALAERGVLVRDVSSIAGLEGCLRVNAARPEDTDAFLRALGESLVEVAV